MADRGEFVAHMARKFGDDEAFAEERWNSARRLLVDGDMAPLPGGSEDACRRILAAWLLTPREAFIPGDQHRAAYLPHALPVGHGQTISAPYMVSRMTAALNPGPRERVLEIGTGSGYQAAVLAVLSAEVRTVEYVGPLASEARERLEALALRRPWLDTIRRRTGNGYDGWPEGAPYDRIIVTCAIDHVPPALLEQLAPGGVLILPVGPFQVQQLLAVRRRRSGEDQPPGPSWSAARGKAFPAEDVAGARFDMTDVYGDGTRVVFVPFVH